MKKITALLVLLFVSLSFVSCNYSELSNIIFVAGMGIDKEKDGSYTLSVETITMSKSGDKGDYTPEIAVASGKTVLEASANLISITSGKLYFNHCQVIIFSEVASSEGLSVLVDMLYKNSDFDINSIMMIAKGTSANEVLTAEPITTRSQSMELYSSIINEGGLEKSLKTTLHDLYATLHEEGQCSILPSVFVKKTDKKVFAVAEGAAVFEKDRFAGFLDGEETRFYLFSSNKIRDGFMSVPISSDDNFSARIKNNRSVLSASIDQDKITLKIDTNTTLSYVGEYQNGIELTKLRESSQSYIKEGIEKLFEKSRSELHCDLFGAEVYLRKRKPGQFEKHNGNFENMTLEVICLTDIRISSRMD